MRTYKIVRVNQLSVIVNQLSKITWKGRITRTVESVFLHTHHPPFWKPHPTLTTQLRNHKLSWKYKFCIHFTFEGAKFVLQEAPPYVSSVIEIISHYTRNRIEFKSFNNLLYTLIVIHKVCNIKINLTQALIKLNKVMTKL